MTCKLWSHIAHLGRCTPTYIMAHWVVLSMRILKDCYEHTCVHHDFTRVYRVTCDLRDELCFSSQFDFTTRIKGYFTNTWIVIAT
jgi:hypothetical protein